MHSLKEVVHSEFLPQSAPLKRLVTRETETPDMHISAGLSNRALCSKINI